MEKLEEIVIPITPVYKYFHITCNNCSHLFNADIKIYPHDVLNPQKLICPHCNQEIEVKFVKGEKNGTN